MKRIGAILFSGIVITVPACSKESLQRAGYETLQNVQQQQCPQGLSPDCPEREGYDDYQRDRTGLAPGKTMSRFNHLRVI